MKSALLIACSSFLMTEQERAWALRLVRHKFTALGPHCEVLIGDAPWTDSHVYLLVRALGANVSHFRCDNQRINVRGSRTTVSDWPGRDRDAAMALALARAHDAGYAAEALLLRASGAPHDDLRGLEAWQRELGLPGNHFMFDPHDPTVPRPGERA